MREEELNRAWSRMMPAVRKTLPLICGVILLGLCAGVHSALGEESVATATVLLDTTDYLIGDWIDVEVDLEHREGASFISLTGDTLGPFTVLRREPVKKVSPTSSTAEFRVALYDTGRVELPPVRFTCRLPGDTTRYEVATSGVELAIHPVQVDTASDIKDIKAPVSLAYTWKEILLPILFLLLLGGGVWLLVRYFKGRNKDGKAEMRSEVKRPPHLVAAERLRAIEARQLWQKGHLKTYHTEVTETIRTYLEGRFGVSALEMTTPEILRQLEGVDTSPEIDQAIERMLRLADLVKFAKYSALPEENIESISKAYEVVDRTAADMNDNGDREKTIRRDNVSV